MSDSYDAFPSHRPMPHPGTPPAGRFHACAACKGQGILRVSSQGTRDTRDARSLLEQRREQVKLHAQRLEMHAGRNVNMGAATEARAGMIAAGEKIIEAYADAVLTARYQSDVARQADDAREKAEAENARLLALYEQLRDKSGIGGATCSHGKAVLVMHVDDADPCTDYLLCIAPTPPQEPR